MPSVVPMKSLLEAGVHFGHRTRRWNPKMKPYIFTERNGIHIIDLQQTIARLNQAYDLVKETVASSGVVLFVGTKRQAQESVILEAKRCNMPYVDQRWLGGTLTNWRTIRQRIDYLVEAEKQQARGEFARLVKKEALLKEREIARLNHRLGGLKELRRLPNLLFVVDVRRDALAIKEANILGIPIIAMVDTNCNPDPIDHVIPSNDDAIRAIKLMLSVMATAALDGQAILQTIEAEEEEAQGIEGEEAMERYLGPSTLAKIQADVTTKTDQPSSSSEEEVVAEAKPTTAETAASATEAEKVIEEVVAEAKPTTAETAASATEAEKVIEEEVVAEAEPTTAETAASKTEAEAVIEVAEAELMAESEAEAIAVEAESEQA